MIIEKIISKGKSVYAVCNDNRETGGCGVHEIIRFDKLELAVIVMRYISGAPLSESNEYRAKEAIAGRFK